MKRSAIKEKEKWDLTKFYSTREDYEKDCNKLLKQVDEMVEYKGKIMESSKSLLSFLELDSIISLLHEKIYVYSYLYHYSDTTDIIGKELKEKADLVTEKITEKTSFVRSEILSVSYNKVLEYIKENKKLKKYSFMLEKMFRYKDHTLSIEEERIISLASNAFGTGDNTFSALDNADARFGKVKVEGEEVELNHSNYLSLMLHKDRKVRERVFKEYYKFFENHKNSIAEMYKGQIKEDGFFTKVHKFDSSIERSLFADDISVDVYNNLIDTIHQNIESLYEYMNFRKDFLGYKDLHMYDIYVDLVEGETKKFSFEEAKNYVLNAVKPLGKKYVEDLTQLFDTRCIDINHNDGKRSGAYQWGCYGIDPYVSINFEGTEDSVSTLAHELGHAMHSYYSDAKQEYEYAQYPIFLAEIASTVNEILLNEYMIKNAKTNEEKLLYITSFLDKFRATVFRQTQFAEFEMKTHEMDENGEFLTVESLADIYYNLNQFYYGKDTISDDEIKYEWSRIPHFYTPFYVYKYATGFCSAIAIAYDIINGVDGAQERYLSFLSSGGSKYPLDTLKDCGVDMTTSEPIEKGIKIFNSKLEEAKNLMKKVK